MPNGVIYTQQAPSDFILLLIPNSNQFDKHKHKTPIESDRVTEKESESMKAK